MVKGRGSNGDVDLDDLLNIEVGGRYMGLEEIAMEVRGDVINLQMN